MYYNDIFAIIPYYDHYGQNCTCIILRDQSRKLFSFSIKQFLQKMFFQLHLDFKAIKIWTTNVLGTKYNNPIIVNASLVFIPVKIRQTIGKQDGCFGYINLKALASIQDYNLFLINNMPIPILSTKAYVLQKQAHGNLLAYTYEAYSQSLLRPSFSSA